MNVTDDDLAQEFHTLISGAIPDRHYRAMRLLLARQAALRIAGPRHRAYFRKYRARLIQDATKVIESRQAYARYRRWLTGDRERRDEGPKDNQRLNRRAKHYRQRQSCGKGHRPSHPRQEGFDSSASDEED